MSTRSSPRASTPDQRGFVLISVLIIAILYLGLIELILMDSTATLRSAARFRARAVARTMAENGVDLASQQMVSGSASNTEATTGDGRMSGTFHRNADGSFVISGTGTATGVSPSSAAVTVYGRITGTHLAIDRTVHSQ